MSFINRISKTLKIWLPDDDEKNKEKGDNFEKYVAEIFGKQKKYFSIVEWSTDIYDKRKGINVQSNKNPDIIIEYKPTREKFAIECKYRSDMVESKKIDDGVVVWAYPEQIKRYNLYSNYNKIPVFIVIGLEGKATNPDFVFCIPLTEAKYPEIYPSVLEKNERIPPNKPFFWRNGTLK